MYRVNLFERLLTVDVFISKYSRRTRRGNSFKYFSRINTESELYNAVREIKLPLVFR
jgi:hypothetical protein